MTASECACEALRWRANCRGARTSSRMKTAMEEEAERSSRHADERLGAVRTSASCPCFRLDRAAHKLQQRQRRVDPLHVASRSGEISDRGPRPAHPSLFATSATPGKAKQRDGMLPLGLPARPPTFHLVSKTEPPTCTRR